MFPKDDKRRLYWLMEQYLAGKIDGGTFCDEYYYSYDLEVDYDTLSDTEHQAFRDLSRVSGRFSQFEEDIKKYPGTYFTEEDLRKKVQETQEKLQGIVLEKKKKSHSQANDDPT